MPETNDEEIESFATYCPDCEAQVYEGEDGHGDDVCIECGSENVFEIDG